MVDDEYGWLTSIQGMTVLQWEETCDGNLPEIILNRLSCTNVVAYT